MKKNEKQTKKKRKKLDVFFTFFWFFKNWLKIGHFGGPGWEPPKTKKNEKKTKKNEKKTKKTRGFLRVLDFSKIC